ncbi:GFA family protein [uncultured Ferrimonas sp.]|uniref:GFA family protein n=1 Tax=uncultured Ferrimonas sp. TaxID=432640 RepID=UPI00260817C4|nr:GFA family protein [uncultured Ferrimonas sp.]
MSPAPVLSGGCLCGAIRYHSSNAPFDADHCHCRQCQRSVGSVLASWMDFKRSQITWLTRSPVEYPSSEKIRRGFCPHCGASISYRHLDHPDYLTLTIASLDNPNQVAPNYHIHTRSQVSWLQINDNCRRYPQQRTEPAPAPQQKNE